MKSPFFKILFLFSLSFLLRNSDCKQICPSICVCDLVQGLKRVDCSSKNIINAFINLPNAVEVLSLDQNSITVLDNNCFSELTSLVNLTIGSNSIHTIYLDSFTKLKSLKHVDLSSNRLEYIDNRIFEENRQLQTLDLSGNKFMTLQDQPFIKSSSLQVLNLRKSLISHIYPKIFSQLRNLRNLDLSDNLMITISTASFTNLSKLKWISLERNRWSCDGVMENVLKTFRQKLITVKINVCPYVKKTVKFEKMQEMPTTPKPQQEIDISSLWMTNKNPKDTSPSIQTLDSILNESCETDDVLVACHHFSRCKESYALVSNQFKQLTKDRQHGITNCPFRYSDVTVKAALYAGLLFGSLAGIMFFYLIQMVVGRTCIRKRNERQRLRRLLRSHRSPVEQLTRSVSEPNENPAQPVEQVRMRRIQRSPVASRPQTSFLASLFKRRRCIRNIRPVSRNLVRRLSRSNLFSSTMRLAQSGSRNPNSNSNNPADMDRDRLLHDSLPDIQISDRVIETYTPAARIDNDIEAGMEGTAPPRSETPPPDYDACFIQINVRK